MSHEAVQNWLRSNLNAYIHRDIVYSHVDSLLVAHPTLSPRTASFTHDDGRTQVLLCIQGTIPVTFKTRTYNIPVAFWIPFDYPRQPPIVYVVPTATMLVRASAAVDVSGRCTGSYWKAWERKSEGCSLVDLAVDYQTMFGKEPPVYAKPAPSANAGPSAGSASPQKSTTPSQSTSYPQRPSQPGDSLQNGQAPSNASEKSSVIPGQGYRPAPKPPQDDITEPVSRSSQPQMPQRPASVSQSLQSPLSNMPRINGNTQPHRPPLPPTPVSGGAPPRPTSSILPQPRSILYSPAVPNSPSHASSMLFMQPPTLPQQPYMYSAPQAASPHPQAQLPPPRRPTNPDIVNLRTAVLNKLTDGLNAQSQVYHNDLAQLELLRQDLLKGEPAIRDEMGRLEAVKNVCMNVRDRYSVLVSDLASHVQNLEERDLGSEDEILACQSVLHSQLLDLVAEDNALEDTIYQLGQGLHNDTAKIDLDTFLKRVRPLAREQFLKRALINKILLDLAVSNSGDAYMHSMQRPP